MASINFALRYAAWMSAAVIFAVQASAATVTDTVSFSASAFTSNFGGPVPTSPVTGSFTISFDPTQTYTDDTAGISLISLNIALSSTLAFDYSPIGNANGTAGQLVVGGIGDGANLVQFTPSTNDFFLHLENLATAPTFGQLGYSQTSAGTSNLFYTTSTTSGSVSVTPFVGGVPEPASWALMLIGFGMLGSAMRRRQRLVEVTA